MNTGCRTRRSAALPTEHVGGAASSRQGLGLGDAHELFEFGIGIDDEMLFESVMSMTERPRRPR
jgi:hypothetical protein